MTPKKYLKMNKRYIGLTLLWFLYTLGLTVYLLNFSNNFYLEVSGEVTNQLYRIELKDKEGVQSTYDPQINGDNAFIINDRVDLTNVHQLIVTDKKHNKTELQVPPTPDKRHQKLRLMEPTNKKYILMQITDKNTQSTSILFTWFILFLLLIISLYDYKRLVRLYKLPLHYLYVYIEDPSKVDYVQAKDTLLHTRLKMNTRRIYQFINPGNSNQADIVLSTFLNQKTRGMHIKVKIKDGDTYYYKPEMLRYTTTTTVVFNATTLTLHKIRATDVQPIEPIKVKERKR